ncbi:glutamate receptor -like [Olea europaea subsp. europaea]|uniref:Glutamate receptor -like n=1 Tax=Olea europaea subsp. europaea TaxID=158383 RepID=A0A8S0PH41_OLEEU|nr:glutamate receptor -like [Olea europaea subsp. europaea]
MSALAPAQLPSNFDGNETQSNVSSVTQNPTTTQPSTAVKSNKTSVHVTALDGIVNVNSLFTMAIFFGFSLTVPAAGSAGHQRVQWREKREVADQGKL